MTFILTSRMKKHFLHHVQGSIPVEREAANGGLAGLICHQVLDLEDPIGDHVYHLSRPASTFSKLERRARPHLRLESCRTAPWLLLISHRLRRDHARLLSLTVIAVRCLRVSASRSSAKFAALTFCSSWDIINIGSPGRAMLSVKVVARRLVIRGTSAIPRGRQEAFGLAPSRPPVHSVLLEPQHAETP